MINVFQKNKTKQKGERERERVWHVNQLLLRTSRVPNPTRRCGRTVRSSASAGSSQLRPGPAPGSPRPRVPRRRRPGARHVRCRRWCSSGQQGAVSARSARPRLPPPRTRPCRLPSICTSASSGEASPALGAQSVARILEKEMINVNTVCPTPHTSASSGAMFLPATR